MPGRRKRENHLEVSCLYSFVDLQRVCQKQCLKLSPETNRYLLYQTLKKLGPMLSQKLIKRMVEKGEIEWDDDEDFEVEAIKDYVLEDSVEYYLIKWKNWSNLHNTWEPKEHLECPDLLKEFHEGLSRRGGCLKRKRTFCDGDLGIGESKTMKINDLFNRISKSQEKISPLKLLNLSNTPTKKTLERFQGLMTGGPVKRLKGLSKVNYNNKRTKAYREMKADMQKALKEWELRLNAINTDPGKITVENAVDLEGPPDNFEYINDYKADTGISIPQDPLVGCECTRCIDNKKHCCGHRAGSEFAYNAYRRLRVPFGTPIYECNKRCECSPECPNRVVQHGRKFKLSIFRTANGRGWGVKTLQDIKQGSFVMEYVGEVITSEEAERRGMMYDAEGRTYLFDLDYNDDDGDCLFTVDAGYYGNISHFVNHSCDPNLHVFGVWINTLDPRLPRIALFAKKDIAKGEELTFDYMMTGATVMENDHNTSKLNESVPNEVTEACAADKIDTSEKQRSVNAENETQALDEKQRSVNAENETQALDEKQRSVAAEDETQALDEKQRSVNAENETQARDEKQRSVNAENETQARDEKQRSVNAENETQARDEKQRSVAAEDEKSDATDSEEKKKSEKAVVTVMETEDNSTGEDPAQNVILLEGNSKKKIEMQNMVSKEVDEENTVKDEANDEEKIEMKQTDNTADDMADKENAVSGEADKNQTTKSGRSKFSAVAASFSGKTPPSVRYRMMCQCGAKNCRKYLF